MIEGQEDVTWDAVGGAGPGVREQRHPGPVSLRSLHEPRRPAPERVALDAWGTITALAAVTSTAPPGHDGVAGHASATPPTWPSWWSPPTTSRAAESSSGSAPAGTSASTPPTASRSPTPEPAMDVLEEQLQVVLGNWAHGAVLLQRHALHARGPRRPAQAGPAPASAADHGRQRRAAQRRALAASYADEYNTPFPTLEDIASARVPSVRPARRPGAIRCRSRS